MKAITFLLSLLLVTACAVQVRTYQKPEADFSSYESWCWLQGCEVVYQGPKRYNDQRLIDEISNAIAWNMNEKGYLQGDDKSDLILNFYLIVEEDSAEVRDLYHSTYADEREWLPMLYPEYQHFLKGSLVIDILDRKASELIWTSTAIRYIEINPTYDPESIWKSISKALKKFPTVGGV